MSLYKDWMAEVEANSDSEENQKAFWEKYYEAEKEVYQKLLEAKTEVLEGTPTEISEKIGMSKTWTLGFIDGISESVKTDLPQVEAIDEDTALSIEIDYEKLLFNMHKAGASWLYELPAWGGIFDDEKQYEIERAYKRSKTVVKGEKVGRNDPCPCGSGKKYKKCCGLKN